jgi:hypothetical protein
MKWMLRLPIMTLFAALALAQTPPAVPVNPPPAEVDQALRERIKQFYDLQVKGQFRQAEAFIAEDTKDFYYNLAKPKYKSIELDTIEYSDDFTRAKAMIWVERYINAPPFPPDVALRGRTPSTWKLENGLWVWYEDLNAPIATPFGVIHPAGAGATPRPAGAAPVLPGIPGGMPGMPGMPAGMPGMPAGMPSGLPPAPVAASTTPQAADFIRGKVKADQTSVGLKHGGSSQVTFTNSASEPMSLQVVAKPDGVTVKPESAALNAGGKQVLTLHAAKGAKAGVIQVRIDPTGEIVPIQVAVK